MSCHVLDTLCDSLIKSIEHIYLEIIRFFTIILPGRSHTGETIIFLYYIGGSHDKYYIIYV